MKKNTLIPLSLSLLILSGCASTDPNAVLTKGRIIGYAAPVPSAKTQIVAPSLAAPSNGVTAGANAAANVALATLNEQRVFYRVKLDTDEEVSMWARYSPPKSLRIGECVSIYLSSKPGYPRFSGRNTNCAYATDGSKAVDANDLAKEFQTDAQYAGVYIYRNELFYWPSMDVMIDGAFVAKPQAFYYVWKKLSPGRHTISAQGAEKNEIEITVEAGRNYFLWLEAKGSYGGPKPALHVVEEAVGKQEISNPELLLIPAK